MQTEYIESFRSTLEEMLQEIQEKGDTTLELMSDSNEMLSDPADRASAESDKALALRLRDRDRHLIRKITEALERINAGEYGICEECGEDIAIARLQARPMTRFCIVCKSLQEERERENK
ncbi:MAG: RNA polymerase-binding protein DksA [Desulfovibrionaceae bacterium]